VGDKELNRLLNNVINRNCKRSFEQIFSYYYPKIVDFADLYLESHELAEEVASDALLKLFLKRHSWLVVEKPEAYLYKTVKNLSLSHLRKANNNLRLIKIREMQDLPVEQEADAENFLIEEEFNALVSRIIENMPPRRRMIFKLIKQEGKSYKDVSKLLNVSVKTVETHMGLAILDIRNSLEKYDKQERIIYLKLTKLISLLASVYAFEAILL